MLLLYTVILQTDVLLAQTASTMKAHIIFLSSSATKVSTPNYTLISFTKRYILIVVAKLFLDIRQTSLMSLLAKQLFKTGLATFKQNHLVTCVKSKVVPGNHC